MWVGKLSLVVKQETYQARYEETFYGKSREEVVAQATQVVTALNSEGWRVIELHIETIDLRN